MIINIDKEACTGCGVCESLCPEVFEVKEDEKAHVITSDATVSECQEAIDSCPVQAISIENEEKELEEGDIIPGIGPVI
jgi:ferredoxin